MAQEIVLIMFGEKWMNAVPIVKILSIYGAIRSTGNPIGALLLAKGKANWGFWWNLGLLFYIPIGIVISSQWGLIGVSWGLVILMSSLVMPNWYFLVRNLCGAGFIEYHKQIFVPSIISLIIGGIIYFILVYFDSMLLRFIGSIVIGSILVIGLNYLINKKSFIEIVKSVRREGIS
jgi:O-antigen/teichoic acid export membrane protein